MPKVITLSGRVTQQPLDWCMDMVDANRAVIVSHRPLVIERIHKDSYEDTLERQTGRRMEGVKRHRFCGKHTTSNPNRIMFPPREVPIIVDP